MEKRLEIHVLDALLTNAQIPHRMKSYPDLDSYYIEYPSRYDCIASVAQVLHMSQGADQDRLEIMGLLSEKESAVGTVAGHLSARNIFNRIEKHWRKHKLELTTE